MECFNSASAAALTQPMPGHPPWGGLGRLGEDGYGMVFGASDFAPPHFKARQNAKKSQKQIRDSFLLKPAQELAKKSWLRDWTVVCGVWVCEAAKFAL